MAYSTIDLDELDGEGPAGMVKKVRRALGAEAFGFNVFQFPPDTEGFEHDESSSGQEEVIFVLSGSGVLRVDGEEVELRLHRFVRLDPACVRKPISGPDGLSFLTIGAPKGAYSPPAWG
ncbi:MAG: cupin domain-containing protein [Gaiellaceae bacterium]